MARKKISEFRAKKLVNEFLGVEYEGASSASSVQRLASSEDKLFVVKVDQGVKKRGKQGLVQLRIKKDELGIKIEEFKKRGFEHFLIEEFLPHESSEEKYLALSRTRSGIEISYSAKGGVDIEENADSIKHIVLPNSLGGDSEDSLLSEGDTLQILRQVEAEIGVGTDILQKLVDAFEKYYFSFMEINPIVVQDQTITFLDLAVEVDSAAEFFVHEAWSEADFRDYSVCGKTPEEDNITELSKQSQASFSLTVLNPDGAIWMLLSGGGASIVLADEAYNQGKGKEVGNYGEYSGNPNEEETYYYTKQVLSLLFKSRSKRKVVIIGGGVANFTDVKKTFKGVVRAIDEVKDELVKHGVKVYVRRGGPNQEEGLALMKTFLEKNDLYGAVHGPDLVLTDVMNQALEYIQ